MDTHKVRLMVNGRRHDLAVQPNATLLYTLRDLGYTDVKNACEIGECGACAVLFNGQPVNSCMVLAAQADGAEIVTNAGLGTIDKPHVIQEAFADAGAVQCGFCTPGMVIATKALLDRNPDPLEAEIREALSGNLCRCTGYSQIVDAVKLAAARSRGERVGEHDVEGGVLLDDDDLALWPASSRSEEGGESDPGERILLVDEQVEAGGQS